MGSLYNLWKYRASLCVWLCQGFPRTGLNQIEGRKMGWGGSRSIKKGWGDSKVTALLEWEVFPASGGERRELNPFEKGLAQSRSQPPVGLAGHLTLRLWLEPSPGVGPPSWPKVGRHWSSVTMEGPSFLPSLWYLQSQHGVCHQEMLIISNWISNWKVVKLLAVTTEVFANCPGSLLVIKSIWARGVSIILSVKPLARECCFLPVMVIVESPLPQLFKSNS